MQVFKTLLEKAEFLTEETKQELLSAMDQIVSEAKQTAAEEVQVSLREAWAGERDALIEALDLQVQGLFESEITELRESVESFYDLEADYATRLVEARQEIESSLKEEFEQNREQLIEQLDTFLQIALEEEVAELREDIEAARANRMGRRIMEAFMDEFREFYIAEDSLEARLIEAEARLDDLADELEEVEKDRDAKDRKIKMDEALAPLTGTAREVMAGLLEGVSTDKIQSTFDRMIGRVLNESVTTDVSSARQLNESVNTQAKSVKGVTLKGDPGKSLIQEQLDKGNYKQVVTESESGLTQWRKLGGL